MGCLIAFITSFLISFICNLDDSSWNWACFIFLGLILWLILDLLIGLLAGFILSPQASEYETIYEVSISPEVSMEQFLDKYELIQTRGSIYTVKEK